MGNPFYDSHFTGDGLSRPGDVSSEGISPNGAKFFIRSDFSSMESINRLG